MAPASMVIVQSAVVEVDEIFTTFHRHIRRLYLGAYAPATDDPVTPTGRAPMHGESQIGEEGGEGLGILTNKSFCDL